MSPIAVASNASAMPGATTARFVVCALEMPMRLFMIPQTVPNSAHAFHTLAHASLPKNPQANRNVMEWIGRAPKA